MKYFCTLSVAFCLLLGGCRTAYSDFVPKSEAELEQMEEKAEKAHELFEEEEFDAAREKLLPLVSEKTVSWSLYQLELLSILLLQQKDDEAHRQLLCLRDELELLTDETQSEALRSIWHGEENKVFKGDSYERAAFYALSALSYLRIGNNEDALRCVKNGLLADADSNSAMIGDDLLLLYLGAFAARKAGDEAAAAEYWRAIRMALVQRSLFLPEDPRDLPPENCFSSLDDPPGNVLLVVWAGCPPTIARGGEYDEKRFIIRGLLHFRTLTLSLNGGRERIFPQALGDLNYQATTRGGRLMDGVLADKAELKKITELSRNIFLLTGTSLLIAGGIVFSSEGVTGTCLMGAGGVCCLIGGVCWIVGEMMHPEADARHWKNLPYQFFVMPLSLPPGEYDVRLRGRFCGDLTAEKGYCIRVREDLPVNVIHLPLFYLGRRTREALDNVNQSEREAVLSKADERPLDKEL